MLIIIKTKPNYEPLTYGDRRGQWGKRLDQSGKTEDKDVGGCCYWTSPRR